MRFLCDAMLGSLARWMRFFGFDCSYADVSLSDEQVAAMALESGRWLLTRDRELASTGPPRSVLIRARKLDDQLYEVFKRFSLTPEASLTTSRCAECNGELEAVSRELLTDVVPPFVLSTAKRFRRCHQCRRVFWPGTHSHRILRRMHQITSRL